MAQFAALSCPYCGTKRRVNLPEGTVQVFPHPIDGKRKEKPESLRKLGPRLFGARYRKEDMEVSVKCKKCEYEFHIIFFSQKTDIYKHFAPEFDGITSRPLADRLLDLFPLPYPISSLLLSLSFWLLWVIPVSLVGGFEKITSDLMGLMSFPSLTIAMFAIRLHLNNIKRLKDPIKDVLKIKKPRFRGWIFERFKCVILGYPGNLHLVDVTAFLGVVVFVCFFLIRLFLDPANAPVELLEKTTENVTIGQFVRYDSYVSAFFGFVYWSIIYFFFGTAFWLALSTAWVVYKIGLWFPLRIDPLDKNGGIKPLGDLAFSGVIPLIAAELFFIPAVATTAVTYTLALLPQILVLGLVTTTTFALFLSSLFSIHDAMVKVKEKALKKIRREYRKVYRQFLEKANNSKVKIEDKQVILDASLSILGILENRIQSMRTWPFGVKILLRTIGIYFVLPVTLFIAQRLFLP